MKYKICKMHFKAGIHVGIQNGDSPCFMADTLFSALCFEALQTESGIDKLIKIVQGGKVSFSNTMPYIKDDYFIMKPFIKIQNEAEGDSAEKKKFKKLKYVSVDKLDQFFKGKLKPEEEIEKVKKLGTFETRTNVNVGRNEMTEPYQTEVYRFHSDAGLYFIVGYQKDDDYEYIKELIQALSYSGIGGKRSRGLGRFEVVMEELPEVLLTKLTENNASKYISLSLSLPVEDEMEESCNGANYQLIKRGGFVASTKYAPLFLKKKDFYCFMSGSVFKHKFHGDVYDVSGPEGKHPVYQYAIPMFMGV